MAESGLGRVTINAGKSRSYGVEAALRTSLTNELSLNASYGYTYATFTDYVTKQKDSEGNLTDKSCLLYTSPSPRDRTRSASMYPSSPSIH